MFDGPPPAPPRPPTLLEVAEAAGVSRATASRVVNGSPTVAPSIAAAVEAAIERLNYVPNRAARSLANRRTMAVSLIIPEDAPQFFGNPYFAAVVRQISVELEASDYVLNLLLVPDGKSDKAVRFLLGGHVDGAIVISDYTGEHDLASLASRLPVVFAGRPNDPEGDRSYWVDIDNRAGARNATRYLIGRGRRSIAMIGGPHGLPVAADRARGWSEALEQSGLAGPLRESADFSLLGGARAMRELLDSGEVIDAVFAASDLMAIGALGVLRDRGIRVPEQIAVMGFDDSPAAAAAEIPLTTVRQPGQESGRRMARMLLQLILGERPPRVQILPTDIVVRASA